MTTFSVRPVVALPAAVLLALGPALPASAAVTVYSGGSVYGDSANDYMSISCPAGLFTVGGVSAGDACAALTSVYVDGQGGTDTLVLTELGSGAFPALTSVSVSSKEGGIAEADNVNGSSFGERFSGDYLDTINAAGGDDLIEGANSASGGDGDDSFKDISSFASGGNGDDRFIQFTVLGGIDGGPGTDSWELDFDQSTLGVGNVGVAFAMNNSALTVDIDGDGMPATSVPANGLEQVYFTLLRQGTQTYDGSAFTGAQHVRGMAGTDTLTGGALDDALYGGNGTDTITGGGGGDVLNGGDGDDTISARDGVADRIDCGGGTDTVVADATDAVTGCETVQLPPVVTPPAPTPPPTPTPTPTPVVPVTSAIGGPSTVTKPKAAKFTFSSATAGATFQCKVDSGRWKSCASPFKVATRKLTPGKHTLRVRAVLAGVVDATPSVKRFKVVR